MPEKNFPQKFLWALLILFVSFDNIFSYIAIVYHNMREWNSITAFFVSITPLFYFISIPLTLLFIYLIIKLVGLTARKEKPNVKESTEKIMLTSLVIAWGISVTSFNFITLLRGFSPLRINYRIFQLTGISIAVIYALYAAYRMKGKQHIK